MKSQNKLIRRIKRRCSASITEQSQMLEISQLITRPKKRFFLKYKYHLIISSLVVIILVAFLINIPNIKIFLQAKRIERHLVRNFSEIDLTTDSDVPPYTPGELLWNNERNLYDQKIRCEIN